MVTLHELILNAAGEGILALDTEGRITFANPAAARMLGYPADALIGRPFRDLTRPAERPAPEAAGPATAGPVSGEALWRSDGTSFPVEYTATPASDGAASPSRIIV